MKLTRIAASGVFLLSALAAVFLGGCGKRRVYYAPIGYGAPPVVVVHHYGGYGGYGAPPTVVHVYHHNGYGGGYGGYGGHTVIIHHHY